MPEQVYDLELDEGNESEMARHGVSADDVRQVLDNAPKMFENKGGRSADLVMVGPTSGGRFLTVPLARTPVPGVW